MVEESIITDISFRTVEDKLSEHKSLSLGLDFKLKGYIREVFTQKNWERAYEKQDYKFRIAFNIDIK